MHLMRCEHGHFYDGDKYPQCPHCVYQGMGQDMPMAGYGQEDSVTVPGAGYGKPDSVTVPGAGYQEDSVTVPVTAYQEDSVTVPVAAYQKEPAAVPSPAYQQTPPQVNGPLRQAVQEAMNSAIDPDEDGKTVSFYQAKRGIDPVAGWLVCIEGEDFGGSFTIKSGRNFVGRSTEMDIVLRGDNSISRYKHAVILYEPKRREFIAQAGESRELFYLNDEVVLNPVKLKQYDILTIGGTRLMFFPCCGENFSWDDFKKSEK